MAGKADTSAEKAYAEAAAEVSPAKAEATKAAVAPPTTAVAAAPAPKPGVAKPAAPAKKAPAAKKAAPARKPAPAKKIVAAKKTAAKKPAVAAKPAPKPVVARKAAAKKPVASKARAKPAKKPELTTPQPTVTELKEKIMATAKTADITKTLQEAAETAQEKFKTAYEKGNAFASEMTEFSKGNVEALVESGKVLAGAMQDMGKEVVEESKSAYETMTADLKAMSAVKSPTELFQLQGDLARRNFDAMMGYGSKSSEKMVKLANEAFAPISSRMSVAAEKLTKAA